MTDREKIERFKETVEYLLDKSYSDFLARDHYERASDVLLMLERQEPVAPEEYTVVVSQYGNAEHKCYRCGACKCGLIRNKNWRQKYCPECGKAVKWDD